MPCRLWGSHGEHFDHIQGIGVAAGVGAISQPCTALQLPRGRQLLRYTINLPVAISEHILLGGTKQ